MAPQSTSHAGVFLESEWIGSGKKFTKDLPAYVKTALEAKLSLPPAILSLVLPLPNATVHTILSTSFPLVSNETNLSSRSTFHFFSTAAPSHPQLTLLQMLATSPPSSRAGNSQRPRMDVQEDSELVNVNEPAEDETLYALACKSDAP
ncbi:hypothetical protein POSPLADRAFT_1155314 [Postia placenta MAD-698-R-SB12]|uniref:Uncharacterized protein n=1 Tax=Postia placenta MAD-698-R-SB12 TaxID=670580 RepID=A0A1X6MNW4_9APHY|nr:hypothetical protein POSPLADRAFT_1155314 [Postia placenta MAD-698-R-SB12]OSX58111.1 hypothetical protein POSPLADRAFT_1155314 [Postia placenta MAD-698-R-SB12]